MPSPWQELETLQAGGCWNGNAASYLRSFRRAGSVEAPAILFYPQKWQLLSPTADWRRSYYVKGSEPGTILPLSGARPLLLIGGTCDGVIAAK